MRKLAIALLLFLSANGARAQAVSRPPLDIEDVITLLELKDVTPEQRIDVLKRRCVSFRPNDSQVNRIKTAGADDAFLGALLTACLSSPAEDAKRPVPESAEPPATSSKIVAKFVYGEHEGAMVDNSRLIRVLSRTEEDVTEGGITYRVIRETDVDNSQVASGEPIVSGFIARSRSNGGGAESFKARKVFNDDVLQSIDLHAENERLIGSYTRNGARRIIEAVPINVEWASATATRLGEFQHSLSRVGDTASWIGFTWSSQYRPLEPKTLEPTKYTAIVKEIESISVYAGTFETFKLDVRTDKGKVGTMWVNRNAPHVIIRSEMNVGKQRLELACAEVPSFPARQLAVLPAEKPRDELAEQLSGMASVSSARASQESDTERRIRESLEAKNRANNSVSLNQKEQRISDAISIAADLFKTRPKGSKDTAASACEGPAF